MHLAGDEVGRDIVDRVRRTESLVNILEDDDFPRSGRWDASYWLVVRHALRRFPRSQTTRSTAPDVRSDRAAVPDNQPDAAAAFIGRTMPCRVPFVEPVVNPIAEFAGALLRPWQGLRD